MALGNLECSYCAHQILLIGMSLNVIRTIFFSDILQGVGGRGGGEWAVGYSSEPGERRLSIFSLSVSHYNYVSLCVCVYIYIYIYIYTEEDKYMLNI